MKKLLFVLCCLAASTFSYAEGIEMVGDPPNEESKPGNRSQALLPTVDYTDGEVTIDVPYQIDDMAVTIRDNQGVILYSIVIPSITMQYSIVLPDTVDADKYSIQIAYGDIHLIGWF
ncbi:MAG: DUF3244 domain-containing protein [Bacteroidaceae bacterium]|nr:DUF3244 domain-containing protein [Bacteroidaceae bacterium]